MDSIIGKVILTIIEIIDPDKIILFGSQIENPEKLFMKKKMLLKNGFKELGLI